MHFYMSKLTREQKIQIYKKRKASKSLQNLSKEYHIRKGNIRYLIRLIDRHGNQVLRKDKNKDYSLSLKEEMTLEEKNAYNEERILYLEAENEYLKNHEL